MTAIKYSASFIGSLRKDNFIGANQPAYLIGTCFLGGPMFHQSRLWNVISPGPRSKFEKLLATFHY